MYFAKCDIAQAAAKNDIRDYLNAPQLDTVGKRVIATDGKILATIPVEIEDGEICGPVPVEAIAAARKAVTARSPEQRCEIRCNGDGSGVTVPAAGVTYDRPITGKFPDIDRVIPPIADTDRMYAIDVALLNRLAKALSTSTRDGLQVTLRIPEDASKPARVESWSNPDAVGVIMPLRLENKGQ